MARAVIILGTLAAILSLGFGLFGTGFGAAMESRGFQAAVLFVPIVLAAGTGLASVAPGFAALTILFGTFGLLYSFGFNIVTALPVLLSAAAGVLSAGVALRRLRGDEPVTDEGSKPAQLSGGNRDPFLP